MHMKFAFLGKSRLVNELFFIYSINYTARGRPPTTTPSNGPPTTTPRNPQRSNSRQAPCIYCYQIGHASTDCPSRISATRHVQSHGMNQQNGTTHELLFSPNRK